MTRDQQCERQRGSRRDKKGWAPADTPMPRVDHSISSSGIPARDVSRDATAANAAAPRTVPHPTSVIIAEAGSIWNGKGIVRFKRRLASMCALAVFHPPTLPSRRTTGIEIRADIERDVRNYTVCPWNIVGAGILEMITDQLTLYGHYATSSFWSLWSSIYAAAGASCAETGTDKSDST